jgi:hypothetical protein
MALKIRDLKKKKNYKMTQIKAVTSRSRTRKWNNVYIFASIAEMLIMASGLIQVYGEEKDSKKIFINSPHRVLLE